MTKQMSDKEIQELLEIKAKHDRLKEINRKSYKKRMAKQKILLKKAKEAGIEVSDKEVMEYLKKNSK